MAQKIVWKTIKRNLEEQFYNRYTNIEFHRKITNSMKLASMVLKQESSPESINNISEIQFQASSLPGLSWLFSEAPCFPVNGNKIHIIHEPTIFYKTLVKKCRTAKRRITLASLYLGTGHLEKNLVSAIQDNLSESKGNLKVNILLDFVRGSRGEVNSRHMLLPLLQQFSHSCQVSLYHTPLLRGVLRKLLPERFNEVVGLQHIKVYLFDDDLLISGANLSNDYFTNRQDRYILIEDCPKLANFYDRLVYNVCDFSFRLDEENKTHLSSSWNVHPYLGNIDKFKLTAKKHVWNLFTTALEKNSSTFSSDGDDTWVFPLVEMGSLGLHHDSRITKKFLQRAEPNSKICFATGYFNLTEAYIRPILDISSAQYKFLMAHPTANGFLGARGLAGGIPFAYTLIAWKFFKNIQSVRKENSIKLFEFKKLGWTFHGKGLWYTLPGQTKPMLTLVGSPNYGARSVDRDLESEVVIVTKNTKLQELLHKEQEHLFQSAIPFSDNIFTPDRRPPYWVYLFVKFFRNFF